MSAQTALDKLLVGILKLEIDYQGLDTLDQDEINLLCEKLIATGHQMDQLQLMNSLTCLSYILPRIHKRTRAAVLEQMLHLVLTSLEMYGKTAVRFLEPRLLISIDNEERLKLATHIFEHVNTSFFMQRETGVWALARVIPHLSEAHKKEFALKLFQLRADPYMRHQVLESLTSLVFSLDQTSRCDVVFFIAERIKKAGEMSEKYFILELLKQVFSSLNDADRIAVADLVAPVIFHTDPDLVRQTLVFFEKSCALLPSKHRFHFAQMLATLLNDNVVGNNVSHTLQQILQHIEEESDRSILETLLLTQRTRMGEKEEDTLYSTFHWQSSIYLN